MYQHRECSFCVFCSFSANRGTKKRGDIPNSMQFALLRTHRRTSWNPRGTLVEPWSNPGGTLPQGRPGPRSLSGLRPQSFQLLGRKNKKRTHPPWNPRAQRPEPSGASIPPSSCGGRRIPFPRGPKRPRPARTLGEARGM